MRVLVKDGFWCVAEKERPTNWRSLPVREPAECPDPSQEQVAAAVAEVADCSTQPKKVPPWEHEAWLNLSESVRKSAKEWGSDESLTNACLCLLAGMFTRDIEELRVMIGVDPTAYIECCYSNFLWNMENRSVVIAEFTKENGYDLEMWLNAMAVNGNIIRLENGMYNGAGK